MTDLQRPDPGFPARFPGCCGRCLDDIRPGELIRSARRGGYVHVECPPDEDLEDDLERIGVCPKCFTLLPLSGRCDCS